MANILEGSSKVANILEGPAVLKQDPRIGFGLGCRGKNKPQNVHE